MKRFVTLVLLLAVGCSLADVAPSSAAKRRASDHAQTQLPSDHNFETGKVRYEQGDYDGAIDSFLQSVYFARNNYQPVAYLWLAKSYMQKHEDRKAIDALKKVIEQSLGSNADAHLLLAEVYLRTDRLHEAEQECYTSMTETLGQAYRAHNVLGKVFEAQGNWAAAEAQYQAALGDKPYTYTEAWMNLAEAQMKQQKWVPALQAFRGMLVNTKKLVGIDYQRIYLDLGICLVAKGDHQGAIDQWHRVLDYNQQNPEAHLQLAMLFDAENHIDSAIKEYKLFIRFSDDTKKIEKAKDRMSIIEHKTTADDGQVEAQRPSPQMRQQAEQQQQQSQSRQNTNARDSGF